MTDIPAASPHINPVEMAESAAIPSNIPLAGFLA